MDQQTSTMDRTGPTATGAVAEVAGTATDEAQRLAGDARHEARDLADTVKEQAATLRDDVGVQGKQLLTEAKQQVATTADSQVAKISDVLTSISDQVNALIDGRPEEAGQVRDVAARAASELTSLAGRIDGQGVEDVLNEVRSFARRKPGTFLLLAGAAGLGVGLVARGARAASEQQATPQLSPGYEPAYPTGVLDQRIAELPDVPPVTAAFDAPPPPAIPPVGIPTTPSTIGVQR